MFEDIEQIFDEINAKSNTKYEPSNFKTIDSVDDKDDTNDSNSNLFASNISKDKESMDDLFDSLTNDNVERCN